MPGLREKKEKQNQTKTKILRVINVKIPLQPHKKYDITQYYGDTWLFIAYSDEKWLYYKFSLHHSYNRFLKGWENTLFELRSERVKTILHMISFSTWSASDPPFRCFFLSSAILYRWWKYQTRGVNETFGWIVKSSSGRLGECEDINFVKPTITPTLEVRRQTWSRFVLMLLRPAIAPRPHPAAWRGRAHAPMVSRAAPPVFPFVTLCHAVNLVSVTGAVWSTVFRT